MSQLFSALFLYFSDTFSDRQTLGELGGGGEQARKVWESGVFGQGLKLVGEFDGGQQIMCRRGISFGEEEKKNKQQHKNGDQTMDGERKTTKCCELKTAPSQMVYM